MDDPISTGIHWRSLRYAYYSSDDQMFGSVAFDFHVAQQLCQAVARGPLHWVEQDLGVWEATDPETGTVYEVIRIES